MERIEKKKWEKPKLIILVRGKPEERVLTVCKNEPIQVQIEDTWVQCEWDNEGTCELCIDVAGT